MTLAPPGTTRDSPTSLKHNKITITFDRAQHRSRESYHPEGRDISLEGRDSYPTGRKIYHVGQDFHSAGPDASVEERDSRPAGRKVYPAGSLNKDSLFLRKNFARYESPVIWL